MSYCLNPNCPNPENTNEKIICAACGSKILLKDRYRPIKFLGAGGMGRNLLAVDEDTPSKRYCVVKQFCPMPNTISKTQSFQKAIELFYREAVQLDRLGLESPQIPQLLAYLEQNKRLYLVQEFIDGQNLLKELVKEGVYNETGIRDFLADLLPVLKFIHDKGVIHRDLKLANIMRRRLDGQLVLIDFGISRQLSASMTQSGETVMGTAGYSPPEQMTFGESYPASDIYSVATSCIHLLTGIHPLRLYNPQERCWLWKQILDSRGVSLSQKLENVLTKMLQTAVSDRYQSVDEVLDDLTEPTVLINPSMGRSYAATDDSRPLLTTQQPRNVADFPCLHSLTAHTSNIRTLAFSPNGRFLASGGDDYNVMIWQVNSGRRLCLLTGHSNWVTSLAFSSDGQTLATASYDQSIILWNLRDGRQIRTLTGHNREVFSVAFSRDETMVASGSYQTIKLWHLRDRLLEFVIGAKVRELDDHTRWVNSVAFSQNGKLLASASGDNTIKLWNVKTGKLIRTLRSHTAGVFAVAFSPDGRTLASGSYDKTIKIWGLKTGMAISTFEGHQGGVYAIAFSQDGKTLVSGSEDGTIKLWQPNKGREICTILAKTPCVYAAAISPDGKYIAGGSEDGTINIWQRD
jgi:WD40 repeat protein/DNA-directed RNA polymerase subunit RPC12/RpoP